jgi:hypothetical protein
MLSEKLTNSHDVPTPPDRSQTNPNWPSPERLAQNIQEKEQLFGGPVIEGGEADGDFDDKLSPDAGDILEVVGGKQSSDETNESANGDDVDTYDESKAA